MDVSMLARACLAVLSVQFTFATASTPVNCPARCRCTGGGSSSSQGLDCLEGRQIDREQLSEQIDSLLSRRPSSVHLRSLRIVNTPLTEVPRSVCRLRTLTQLTLANNRLIRLPDNCFNNISSLTTLDISNNNITQLQDGLFDGLRSLVTLQLSNNQISDIGLRVFNSSSTLTSLRYVNLIRNRLTTLEPWPYFIGANGNWNNRAYVDLSKNSIGSFTNKMKLKLKCGIKPVYLFLILERNFIKHVSDILLGWNIGTNLVTLLCLSPTLHPVASLHVSLKYNFLDCDCLDFKFYKFAQAYRTVHFLDKTYCGDPVSLTEKRVLSVHLDQFVCELTERCPAGCRCVHRPANATLHVNCFNANLTVLPLQLPELPKSYTKYKLDFSNNRFLHRLEHRQYFINTSILDVSNCGIKTVDNWTKVFRIKHVYLHGNQLASLASSIANLNLSGAQLSLYDNPWRCSCDDRWMANWLNSVSGHLRIPGDISCEFPSRLRGKNILQISDKEFCVDPTSRAYKQGRTALTIGMSTISAAVLLLLSVGVAVYRLRVRMYSRWKFHPFDRDECLEEDMNYDVFLSSSSDDNLPHGNAIREQLEQRGYRVCYPPRDFVAGETIFDNIYSAVVHSKRTVCLLTPNFPRSNFCMYEFDTAYHHNVMVKRKKRLIVLMALDSPIELYAMDASDTAALRQYLSQYTYIDYTADDWLDNLLYALPLHGIDRHQEATVNEDNDVLALH